MPAKVRAAKPVEYSEHANANRRPRNRSEIARIFTECVSCGSYKVLSATEDIPAKEAIRRAHKSGWAIAGTRRHKNTRCRNCRQYTWGGQPHRRFAENDFRYGLYSRSRARTKPIQRSTSQMSHPDNPPLDPLVNTTIPVELLKGRALMAHVEAAGEYGADWAPPDPLKLCTRCKKHAALYMDGERYICGPCGPRVSVFRLPMKPDDLRQIAADLALEQFEKAEAGDMERTDGLGA